MHKAAVRNGRGLGFLPKKVKAAHINAFKTMDPTKDAVLPIVMFWKDLLTSVGLTHESLGAKRQPKS